MSIVQIYFMAWLALLAGQTTPGPNMMSVAGVALSQGRRPALLVAAGVVSGTLVWALSIPAGLGAAFRAMPSLLIALKVAGGLYLLYLALRSLRAAVLDQSRAVAARRGEALSPVQCWRRGLLVVLLNAKAAVMWSAIATILYGGGLPPPAVLAFAPLAIASAIVVYGSYALLFSSRPAIAAYLRFARWFEAGFALVFLALGILLAWSGIADLLAR